MGTWTLRGSKDYAFGHFLMCFDSVKGFTKECEEAQSLILKPKPYL